MYRIIFLYIRRCTMKIESPVIGLLGLIGLMGVISYIITNARGIKANLSNPEKPWQRILAWGILILGPVSLMAFLIGIVLSY